jgi:hypothetical protein
MRIGPAFSVVAAVVTTTLLAAAASASDVRLLSFPDSVFGSWAPSADACKGSAPGKVDIAAKTHSNADASCEISWVTVTPSRDGPVYSARSMCKQAKTGQALEPSYLVVTPRPGNTLLVRMPFAKPGAQLVTYQKC